MIINLPITCKQGSWAIRYLNIPIMIATVFLVDLNNPNWMIVVMIVSWSVGLASWLIYIIEQGVAGKLPEFSIRCKCDKDDR